ncbi:heterokaryon incompatibility protein-domain-containing protein [Lasiosphaeria ovina]|uniref:Heterokaryon incompatibility protein-domain-containing protein n=1 Tax=Lasiosphaeria ovina TaxID=92902 RepID=A0AAE0KGG1_9PEZI|nr:heterokaryon incompatibility protein-domain-containing protein [Lasiosphaeria ovina]
MQATSKFPALSPATNSKTAWRSSCHRLRAQQPLSTLTNAFTMWLINCSNYALERFDSAPHGLYLILSHTWGDGEVAFGDMANLEQARKMKGFQKIRGVCRVARSRGFSHAWVDTCCIDKTSSAELSESINSMFHWYRSAAVCIALLEDLDGGGGGGGGDGDGDGLATEEQLRPCRWFTRGWTLQEMIAPVFVEFYDKRWKLRGTKGQLISPLHAITRIDEDVLNGAADPLSLQSVAAARRMSWAADRTTTRVEDLAYCLMGIFGLNMPLLYGEGPKAFQRLQEMIVRTSGDMSVFAWHDPFEAFALGGSSFRGLFAAHPSQFRSCTTIETIHDPVIPAPSIAVTNAGIEFTTALASLNTGEDHLLHLNCTDLLAPREHGQCPIVAIWLWKTAAGYVRTRSHELCVVDQLELKFEDPAPVRILPTLGGPMAGRLRSGGDFPLGVTLNIRAPGVAITTTYHPGHLWDQKRSCFVTGGVAKFIGLVELGIPTTYSDKPVPCWVFCMLVERDLTNPDDRSLEVWAAMVTEDAKGSIPGLDRFQRSDFYNPFSLSSLGYLFRMIYDGGAADLPKNSVVDCGPGFCIQLSTAILRHGSDRLSEVRARGHYGIKIEARSVFT